MRTNESRQSPEERVPIEELQIYEYIALFLGLAGLFAMVAWTEVSLGVDPKLAQVEHIRAPWIFGGIQQLLLYSPVWVAGWLFPLVSLSVLLTLPWWSRKIGQLWTMASLIIIIAFWSVLTVLYIKG